MKQITTDLTNVLPDDILSMEFTDDEKYCLLFVPKNTYDSIFGSEALKAVAIKENSFLNIVKSIAIAKFEEKFSTKARITQVADDKFTLEEIKKVIKVKIFETGIVTLMKELKQNGF